MLEHMADYAQKPLCRHSLYFQTGSRARWGPIASMTLCASTSAPGVDHVGSGAPANVDMLSVLVAWVEKGHAPGALTVNEQSLEASPKIVRARLSAHGPPGRSTEAGDGGRRRELRLGVE